MEKSELEELLRLTQKFRIFLKLDKQPIASSMKTADFETVVRWHLSKKMSSDNIDTITT